MAYRSEVRHVRRLLPGTERGIGRPISIPGPSVYRHERPPPPPSSSGMQQGMNLVELNHRFFTDTAPRVIAVSFCLKITQRNDWPGSPVVYSSSRNDLLPQVDV